MASTKCSIDGCKRPSDTFCDHCEDQVCTKHYIQHVREANDQLLVFADELNCLMDELQRQKPIQKALEELDEWRAENHRKIDQIYEEKRNRLQLDANQKMNVEIEKLSSINQRVKEMINEGDVSFNEISDVKTDIEKCRQRCEGIRLNGLSEIEKDTNVECVGRLLSVQHKRKLTEWIGREKIQFKLIYQASRDGFESENFHAACDGAGPTVTIIESKPERYLFGGYTSKAWNKLRCYVSDHAVPFIFTLTNPHRIPPTKYPIHRPGYAILCQPDYGPTFGGGHDIYVSSESDTSTHSSFNFPHSYTDTTNRGTLTFTGSRNFQSNEIEVYLVVFPD